MYINNDYYQVMFRYALAILKSIEDKLLRQNDYMSIFSTFRTEVESLSDVKRLTQVSWAETNYTFISYISCIKT